MQSKNFYGFVLVLGFILTTTSGFMNVIGLLGLNERPLTHVTGTFSRLSLSLVKHTPESSEYLMLIASFLLGSFLSAILTGGQILKPRFRYSLVLLLESIHLLLAANIMVEHHLLGEGLIALAAGMQNSMAATFAGAVLRTTHLTGLMTDLGIQLALLVRGETVSWDRVLLMLVLMTGFFVGGVFGGTCFYIWGYQALYIPGFFAMATALIFCLWIILMVREYEY